MTLLPHVRARLQPPILFQLHETFVTHERILILTSVLFGVFCGNRVCQQPQTSSSPNQSVVPATDGIFAAFQTHSVVGIADFHGLAQEEDFYVDLIRDPRFAKEVGNVIAEFGGAAQQKTIDRYAAGEDIPFEQLRRIWTDTAGWNPTVTSVGYLYFFAQVRAANEELHHLSKSRCGLASHRLIGRQSKLQRI